MARDLIGRLKEAVGWLTADRRAEAEGRLRQVDEGSDADEEDAAEAVAEAERDHRRGYGEYDPAVDDAAPAHDVPPADERPG